MRGDKAEAENRDLEMRKYRITITFAHGSFTGMTKEAQTAYYAICLFMDRLSPLEQKEVIKIEVEEIF